MTTTDKILHPPVLLEYFRRVKAEVLNFRRAMIKEFRGNYYVEKTLIKINSDGSLDVSNKEHAPTKEEAAAIKAALQEIEFPKSIGASESAAKAYIKDFAGRLGLDVEDFYIIRERRASKIAMIQERRNMDDGGKIFIPHTLWSDGIWRTHEPEGLLPFWKPRERTKARIMIHEGAKAARYIDWVINDRSPEAKKAKSEHPWAEELESYEHWGVLGGALAPHRADYNEIRREQPIEVVYVCDNDWPGRSVLKDFSHHFAGSLKGIMFDSRFKESFDLADPLPEKLFKTRKGVRRWTGPTLRSMMIAATSATEALPNPSGKGPPIHVLRRVFREEWMHVVSPEVYIHNDWANRILNVNEFNSTVRPFSHVDDTARLVKADQANKARKLHYMPGSPSGFFGDNMAGQFLNTYCAPDIKPVKGDAGPWLEFMEKLIPDPEDRTEVLRWCATLIARPAVKMTYGLLLISETQGVGKGTLGEKVLAPLVGIENVSFPSEKDVVESAFNGWIAHKRLTVVAEIYAGASSKAYNSLKSIITDKYITVNKKHQATYDIENWLHVFACSNSTRALKLSFDDRRWYVPKVTEEKRPRVYWTEFNDWLVSEDGLGIVLQWAHDWLLDNMGVFPGADAPDSAAKREMIEDSMSPGMTLVAQALDAWKESANGSDLFTTDLQLIEIIRNKIYDGKHSDRLEKPATIRRLAKTRGWYVGEAKTTQWEPKTGQARVVATSAQMAEAVPAELAKDGKEPLGFKDLAM